MTTELIRCDNCGATEHGDYHERFQELLDAGWTCGGVAGWYDFCSPKCETEFLDGDG